MRPGQWPEPAVCFKETERDGEIQVQASINVCREIQAHQLGKCHSDGKLCFGRPTADVIPEPNKLKNELESYIEDGALQAGYNSAIEYQDHATRILSELHCKNVRLSLSPKYHRTYGGQVSSQRTYASHEKTDFDRLLMFPGIELESLEKSNFMTSKGQQHIPGHMKGKCFHFDDHKTTSSVLHNRIPSIRHTSLWELEKTGILESIEEHSQQDTSIQRFENTIRSLEGRYKVALLFNDGFEISNNYLIATKDPNQV
ncbi:hypothetical protein HPB48_020633 [Haemaphysalis longicornis]|uniref:Uncharacterized protein n=1 Tax=Haemaphysalis longicornis TaxID=44386 RepID=A0A9J6GKE0_HAELO|nr:hypothetical protein HPB48_020633 [Haemaphysalis longicornis]